MPPTTSAQSPAASLRAQTDLTTRTSHLAGRYLTFMLGRELFALPAHKVRQILALPPLAQVRKMPGFMRGTVLLRGHDTPVVSLRARFGMPDATPLGCEAIIVFDLGIDVGLIVDRPGRITQFSAPQISLPSPLITNAGCHFIRGIAQTDGTFSEHVMEPSIEQIQQLPERIARSIGLLTRPKLNTVALLDIAEVIDVDQVRLAMG